jgi:hypothetical protein
MVDVIVPSTSTDGISITHDYWTPDSETDEIMLEMYVLCDRKPVSIISCNYLFY